MYPAPTFKLAIFSPLIFVTTPKPNSTPRPRKARILGSRNVYICVTYFFLSRKGVELNTNPFLINKEKIHPLMSKQSNHCQEALKCRNTVLRLAIYWTAFLLGLPTLWLSESDIPTEVQMT
jgi:hypothetical protein